MKKIIFTAAALLCGTLIASAQEPTIGMFGMPKAADCTFDPYVEAPEGFDAEREGIERGTVELVEYKSTTVGTVRKCNVYLPPKYDASKKYPVLYLLTVSAVMSSSGSTAALQTRSWTISTPTARLPK